MHLSIPFTAIVLGGLLLCVSCAPQNTARTSLVPRAAPEAAFPAPLPGDPTPGVVHVQQVLELLNKYDRNGRNRDAQTIGFRFPENEINEYLAYSLKRTPRPGISRAAVRFLPNNTVSSLVEIDFDALQKWHSWLLPSFLRPLLKGKRPVQLDAAFQVSGGAMTLTLKDAYGPDGAAILSRIMEDMIQAIGLHQPEWYDTSRPIPLPYGLQRLWTEARAVAGET